MAASLHFERYRSWAAALAFLALAGLSIAAGWWPRHGRLILVAAADLVLIFAYLWSLGEEIHIVIRVGPHSLTAQVGRDRLAIPRSQPGSGIGLQSGTMWDYRVQPTGEALAYPSSAPLHRFGDFVRLATPQPAWTNLQLASGGAVTRVGSLTQIRPYTGAWSVNPRGELEGDVGASALVNVPSHSTYTVSADLARPDGTQGLVVGISPALTGYYFAVRMDRPDLTWFRWDRTGSGATLAAMPLDVSPVPVIQRLLRIALGNVIVALVLLALAVPLYLLVRSIPRLDRRRAAPFGRITVDAPFLSDNFALVLAVAGAVATGTIASQLLQEIPHVQDSVAYLFQARTLASGALSAPAPRLPSFFAEEFIPLYHGRWFGKYPPGWPLLLAVGVLARIPWLVNPVLSGANLGLLYLIGREVYGRPLALLGAFLSLTSPLLLFLGGSFMAHTATLFYLLGFAYLSIRWVRRVEGGRAGTADDCLLFPAGLLLGMGFITRELDAVAFAAPFAVLLHSGPVLRRVRSVSWLVGGAALPAIFLLVYNWRLTGSPLTSPYTLWWSFDRVGFHSDIGSGFGPAQGLWNTTLNLQFLQAHLFGWPFYFTLALAALPFLLGRATRWDTIFGLSALAVIIAYVFYWNPGVMYGPRYYSIAVPWLALLTARGLQELQRWPLRLPIAAAASATSALLAPSLLLAGLLAYNFAVYLPAQIPMYRGYNFTSAAPLDAVRRAGVHHALVFVVANPGVWWTYGDVFSANAPTLDGDVVYARDQGKADAALIRLYPGRAYYRLDGTALSRIRT